MSVSWSATLIAGFRVSDLCRKVTTTRTVTRYHEVTGQPYQKEVAEEAFEVLGKPWPMPGSPYDPGEWRDLLPSSRRGAVVVEGTGTGYLDDHVWGVKLAPEEDESDYLGVTALTQGQVDTALTQAAALLTGLADRVGVVGPLPQPRLYLVRYCV